MKSTSKSATKKKKKKESEIYQQKTSPTDWHNGSGWVVGIDLPNGKDNRLNKNSASILLESACVEGVLFGFLVSASEWKNNNYETIYKIDILSLVLKKMKTEKKKTTYPVQISKQKQKQNIADFSRSW